MNDEDVQAWSEQTKRLQHAVTKLAGALGMDIAELIEEELLQEGDMN